jgi:hypothetical protein
LAYFCFCRRRNCRIIRAKKNYPFHFPETDNGAILPDIHTKHRERPIKADGRPMEGHFAGYPAARPWVADFVDIRQEKRAKRAKTRPDIHTDRRRRPICWISGRKVLGP